MFEGLYSYEKVLMVLGIILFVLLAGALVWFIVKKRNPKQLLGFFILTVLMIGFPAIQKISYEEGKVTLETNLRRVTAEPKNEYARADLKANINKMAQRSISDPVTSLKIARGYQALNEPQKALQRVDSLLRVNPNFIEATKLRSSILRNDIRESDKSSTPIQ